MAQHGDAFIARRMGATAFGREGDPFFNVDHFRMGRPTFPPHAHAGFSAVTYMLPESAGGMLNRDSRGDRTAIPPGGLHWTAAGSGIVHEEVPERDGTTVEGLQIFVRQPVAQETVPPVIHHVEPNAVPVVPLGRGHVRVLTGSYGGRVAPFDPPSPLALFDVALPAGEAFDWTPQPGLHACSVYLFAGRLEVAGREIAAPALVAFVRGEAPIQLEARDDARLVLFAGTPLDAPSFSNGPFVLSSEAALDDAVRRYRSGTMGMLR
jgi:redox-sensitive bicupin YhaK (pirin superfamily)